MEFKYDPETDILLIKLAKDKPDFGEQVENIITHYDKRCKPIEIEILDASKTTVKIVETLLRGKRLPVALSPDSLEVLEKEFGLSHLLAPTGDERVLELADSSESPQLPLWSANGSLVVREK